MRTYVIRPDLLDVYLQQCADSAHLRKKLNPGFLCFFIAETGTDVNEVTHMYAYHDYDHRDKVRAAMSRDPDWTSFLVRTKLALVSQKSEMFLPAKAALVGVRREFLGLDCHEATTS